MTHQDIQSKLQDEISTVLGSRPPTLADKQSLPYCEAVIEEVMRISPLAFFAVPHVASKDTTIGKYFCPKGTTVCQNSLNHLLSMASYPLTFFIQAILFTGGFQLSEKHFKDPRVFKPERFIDDGGKFKASDVNGVFSFGKRRCPGEILARAEVRRELYEYTISF